jgi:hypothetical protein
MVIPDEAVPIDIIAARTDATDVSIEVVDSLRCATMAKHVRMVEQMPEIPCWLLNWTRDRRRSDGEDFTCSCFGLDNERAANRAAEKMLDA